jgi:hypothetical protein
MNYSKNKNDLSNFGNETPSLYTQLTNTLKSKTKEDTPFVLLPVRLETRFMKVVKNYFDSVYSKAYKELVSELEELISYSDSVQKQSDLNISSARKASGNLVAHARKLFAKSSELDELYAFQKVELLQLQNTAVNTTTSLFRKLISSDQLSDISTEIETTQNSTLNSLNETARLINITNEIDVQTEVSRSVLGFGESLTILENAEVVESQLNAREPMLSQNLNNLVSEFETLVSNLESHKDLAIQDKIYLHHKLAPINDAYELISGKIESQDSHQEDNDLSSRLGKASFSLSQIWKQKLTDYSGTAVNFPKNYSLSQFSEEELRYCQTLFDDSSLKTSFDNVARNFELIQNKNVDVRLGSRLALYVEGLPSLFDELASLDLARDETYHTFLGNKFRAIAVQLAVIDELCISDEVEDEYIISLKQAKQDFEYNSAKKFKDNDHKSLKLETTYEAPELWVRVYPDDIHINHHEPKLTLAEEAAGKAYWEAWKISFGNKDVQLEAWQVIVALYGQQRAAWIIKSLTPTNITSTVPVNNIFQVSAHFNALNIYVCKFNEIDAEILSNTKSLNAEVQLVKASLESINEKLVSIESAEASSINVVRKSLNDFTGNLSGFKRKISVEDAKAFTSLRSIDNLVKGIEAEIKTIQVLKDWPDLQNLVLNYPIVEIKDGDWTEASFTQAMPDRFLFATVNPIYTNAAEDDYTFTHVKIGNLIPAKLFTGIDPSNTAESILREDTTNLLQFDDNLKWLFDYPEAVKVGMACSIPLTDTEFEFGFQKLIVLGAQLGENSTLKLADLGKQNLEALLDNHHYSPEGMSIVEYGTATNNTETSNAGFNNGDPLNKISFEVEVADPLFSITGDKLQRKDGQWISDALGIDIATMEHVKRAGGNQTSNALAVNKALWHGTIGNYLDVMLNRLVSQDTNNKVKDYFTEYVIARGAVPSLRIGRQPYGILPTTSFTRWEDKVRFKPTSKQATDLNNLLELPINFASTQIHGVALV